MNTNNLEDIGESPDKFDAKRISTFFVSNLIRSGDFILNEKFLDMISCYYGYSGKSFPEEVKKIIKNFLLNKKIKKKTIKKIVNKYNGVWRDFFYDISFMANVPIKEIESDLTEALKTKVLQELVDYFNLSSINLLSKRNSDIKSFFSLNDIQLRIILVSIIISESKMLQNYIRELDELERRKAISGMVDTSSKIVIDELLSLSKLKSLQILDNKNLVLKEIKEYIIGLDESFVTKIIKEDLETDNLYNIETFNVSDVSKNIILRLLKLDKPVKILLYGEPGSGKTEFAKSIIKASGNSIATPIFPNECNQEERFYRCSMAEYVSHKKGRVALIDECDDIISTDYSFRKKSGIDKECINSIFDQMEGKSIWITNSINFIDKSILRRFTYSVEFNGLSRNQKITSLKELLNSSGIPRAINAEDLYNRLQKYSLPTAGILSAVNLAYIAAQAPQSGELLEIIDDIAKAQSTLLNGSVPKNVRRYKPDTHFDPSIINMDIPYEKLIYVLKSYDNKLKEKSANCPMNLIFEGVSGSGKTELAKHIAQVLDKKIILKNMSDLQSAFVGETEKNIANAFNDAEREDAILVIDEADSLFVDRQSSVRSWEVSQTNEILIQMENYRGIFICSTNIIESIDSAAMRRFQKKITFTYLNLEARKKLFKSYFLNPENEMSAETIKELEGLNNLTAGDFKNVYQQIQFDDNIQYEERDFIEMLKRELKFKKDLSPKKGKIGFCA